MNPDKLTELDVRQTLLGALTLLLIVVHMIFPAAGIDGTSIILLVFLALVLYGDELTLLLADLHKQRSGEEHAAKESELRGKVREIAYRVEHARVAFGTEGMDGGGQVGKYIAAIMERASGEPRAALLLVWGALEDRLRAVSGAGDGLEGARRLTERGAVPRQFVEAFDGFRTLRNDIARGGNGEATPEILWSLVDVGGALLGLIPDPRQIEQEKMGI
jgi:hypothetical protein